MAELGLTWNQEVMRSIRSNIVTALERKQEVLRESLEESARELEALGAEEAPRDTGYLEELGHRVEEVNYGEFAVIFSALAGDRARFAGLEAPPNPDLNYAWIQHENLEFRHRKGKAKYLSDPYNRFKDEWLEKAALAVSKVDIPMIKISSNAASRNRVRRPRGRRKGGR